MTMYKDNIKYTRKRKEIRVIVPNFTVLSKSITSDV